MASKARYGAPTPLPKGPLLSLCVVLFCNSVNNQLALPFAPLMVANFHVTDNPSKIGYYTGYLASAVFAGGLLSSLFWGTASDAIGRKPVIVIGLVSNIACSLVFGFSTSFAMATAARFFNGLLSGILIISRSAMAEICDESNQAKGFSFLALNRGLGLMFGPVVGGLLAQPVQKYPWLFPGGGLFETFQFALPCLVVCALTGVALLLTLCFFPETRGWVAAAGPPLEPLPEAARRGSQLLSPSSRRHLLECQVEPSACPEHGAIVGEYIASKRRTQYRADVAGGRGGGGGGCVVDMTLVNEYSKTEHRLKTQRSSGLGEPLLLPKMLASIEEDLAAEAEEELLAKRLLEDPGYFRVLFPLWALTGWELGGLGSDTTSVALAQAFGGLSLIGITMWLYPTLVNKLGGVAALQLSIGTGILQAFIPFVRAFGQSSLHLRVAVLVIFAIRSFNESAMLALFVLTSNSVRYPQYMGAVIGMLPARFLHGA
eukprot:jgi/Mesen1/5992/ME000304S05014